MPMTWKPIIPPEAYYETAFKNGSLKVRYDELCSICREGDVSRSFHLKLTTRLHSKIAPLKPGTMNCAVYAERDMEADHDI
eukprot:scaffold133101_cov37-Tisochrysis_lutea.AAC.4